MKAAGNHQMLEIATNGKARRDYHISETFEAGIELKGTEVKSIRLGKINLRDAFARVEGSQVFLYGCDIQPMSRPAMSSMPPSAPAGCFSTSGKSNAFVAFPRSKVRLWSR
ncbi:MAG: SsrA-binding protein [Verrucomicrobiales bacterium]